MYWTAVRGTGNEFMMYCHDMFSNAFTDKHCCCSIDSLPRARYTYLASLCHTMHGVAAVTRQDIMEAVYTLLLCLSTYMRITRYVQTIGYGPVLLIT